MKVGIILPSRGLMFSQTADEILQNIKDVPHKLFFSHRRPIPECFEEPTLRALEDKEITHLWFVEDDMILSPDTLKTMLEMNVAAVTADYPINRDGRGAVFKDSGKKVLITGTGCLLIRREVFEELKKPYFRTDIRWNIKNMGGYIKLTGAKKGDIDGYGLHDVNFSMNLHRLNIPIHVIDNVSGQRKLVALGKAGTNNGAHNIETWTKVKKDHLLKTVKKWPVLERGDLVTVNTPTGQIQTSAAHARKLIKTGLATRPPRQHSVIDWGSI